MANINIVHSDPLTNGTKLRFKTPCDSTEVEQLIIKAPNEIGTGNVLQNFGFVDANGVDLSGMGNVFAKDVMLEVILDVSHRKAYILNGNTNSYLESLKEKVNKMDKERQDLFADVNEQVKEIVSECKKATDSANKASKSAIGVVERIGIVDQNSDDGEMVGLWTGTSEQYEALPEEDKMSSRMHFVTDDETIKKIYEKIHGNTNRLDNTDLNVETLRTDLLATNTNVAALNTSIEMVDDRVDEVMESLDKTKETVEDIVQKTMDEAFAYEDLTSSLLLESTFKDLDTTNLRLVKIGKVIHFYMHVADNFALAVNKTDSRVLQIKICTIPAAYLPPTQLWFPVVFTYSVSGAIILNKYISILENGEVWLRVEFTNSRDVETGCGKGVAFNTTYILENEEQTNTEQEEG